MAVIFQDRISRSDIQSRPKVVFVFGDNEQRTGMGGQAAVCRGERNAVGVATKRTPTRGPDAYWSDDDFERCAAIIDADFVPVFAHVRAGGDVVIPRAGIGTGRSELPLRAPRLMEHIRTRVRELKALANSVQRV